MKALLIILLVFVFCMNCFGQDSNNETKAEQITFDVHLAASIYSGLRAGGRYYFIKNFSAEISYGVDLGTLGADGGQLIEFGLNYYLMKDNALHLSLIGLYGIRSDYDSYYIISPMTGFFIPGKKSFQFLARAGLNIIRTSYQGQTHTKLKPNLEIGIGVSF